MAKAIENKMFTEGTGILDIDESTKQVKIAIAAVEKLDRDGDVFDSKAFNRTIAAHGPKGSNEVWHLLDHRWGIREGALSKASELYMEGQYLVLVSKYRDSFNWREVAWPLYANKDITQHSVGFYTNTSEDKKDYRLITDVTLLEGSAVLWGAQSDTPTLEVVKNFIGNIEKEMSIDNIGARFAKIYKGIKENKYEDLSLLNLEFKYLERFILESTKDTSSASDNNEQKRLAAEQEERNAKLREALTQFNLTLQNL